MDIITSAMLGILGEREQSVLYMSVHVVDGSHSVYTYTLWSVKNGKTQCIRVIDVDLRTSQP